MIDREKTEYTLKPTRLMLSGQEELPASHPIRELEAHLVADSEAILAIAGQCDEVGRFTVGNGKAQVDIVVFYSQEKRHREDLTWSQYVELGKPTQLKVKSIVRILPE